MASSSKRSLTDIYGGLQIDLGDSICLHIFPDSSKNEAWRFFRPGSEEHFVIGNTEQMLT